MILSVGAKGLLGGTVVEELLNFIASFIYFATNSQYNARGLVSASTGGSTCDIT